MNPDGAGAKPGLVGSLKQLSASRTALFTYVGSGLAMFMPGVLNAWLPTFVHRSYHVPLDKSGLWAGVAVLVMGVGMIVGGSLVDRLGRREARNKLRVPAVYGALTCVLLGSRHYESERGHFAEPADAAAPAVAPAH